MTITSNDPGKYYRASIAMALERKSSFDGRLRTLGLRTLGDLVTMFTLTNGVVEALEPIAEQFHLDQVKLKAQTGRRQGLLKQLKSLSADELQNLMWMAASQAPVAIATIDERVAHNQVDVTRTTRDTNI